MQTQMFPSHFNKGAHVEVIKPTRNSLYPATVLRAPTKQKKLIFVEYQTLFVSPPSSSEELEPPKSLRVREYINVANLRPKLPLELNMRFNVGDRVDAYREIAWCPGVVKDILENSKYMVAFEVQKKKETVVIEQCNLRLHRQWVDGSWLPPIPDQEKPPPEMDKKSGSMRFRIKYSRRPQESKFRKGTLVEVSSNEEGYKGAWFTAAIVDSIGNDRFLVQYRDLTTDDGSQPLKEEANARRIRPFPPQVSSVISFKQFWKVDAWYNDGWWEGIIVDALKSGEYAVHFMPPDEIMKFDKSKLRPHQDWINGEWVMASKSPVMDTESESMRFKIKYSRRPRESNFKMGTLVEVSSCEEGYKGAWFTANIVDSIENDRFLVQYRELTTDDGSQPLKEEANARHIRPFPPPVSLVVSFKQFQKVDAWYNDGWWEGMIVDALKSGEYGVHIMPMNETMRFEKSKLRPHQDWINGEWVMASKKSSELAKMSGELMLKTMITGNEIILKYQKSSKRAKKSRDIMSKTKGSGNKFRLHFCKGARVEVRSDEAGYQGAWYTAVVVGLVQNGKYLVEYQTLKTDDFTEQLKEEADASYIRPYPPDVNHPLRFALCEWVDAWYNDGWWVGQVASVLHGWKYRIYFRPTNEVLEFEHCHLRLHQEWINGEWLVVSSG